MNRTLIILFRTGIVVLLGATLAACGGSNSNSDADTTNSNADDLAQVMAAPELDPADQVVLDGGQPDLVGQADGRLGGSVDTAVAEDNGDLIPAVFATETTLDLAYAQAGAALVESLNESLALPADISVSFADCGTANAFFVPAEFNPDENGAAGGAIVMCHELTELFFNLFGNVDDAFQTSVFVLMHELGHALVDQLNLPVLGIEEAAVDGIGAVFSTKIGLAEGVVKAGWFFFSQGDSPFFDTHRVGSQRLGDLACWGVGGDPSLLSDPTISNIKDMLVDSGRDCDFEYQQRLNAVNTLVGPNIKGGLVDVEVITPQQFSSQ